MEIDKEVVEPCTDYTFKSKGEHTVYIDIDTSNLKFLVSMFSLNEKITSLEQEFKVFRADIEEIKSNQQVMSGNIQLIVQTLNGPMNEEKKASAVYSEFKNIIHSWKAWVLMILVIMAIALAGEKLLQLLNFVPTGFAG